MALQNFLIIYFSLFLIILNGKPPNIIFIVSDDLGYDDLGFQGHQIHTPNIDKYRSEGQFLEWYYGQPNCSPTRSAIMTGKYPVHTGITTWIRSDQPVAVPVSNTFTFFPKLLRKYGNYDTHAIGKWHVGFYKWNRTPTFRGFNSFYGYYGGGEDYYTHKGGGYFDFRDDIGENCGVNCSRVATETYNNYSTILFTNRAIEIVQNHSLYHSDQSLFLYLAYQSVHAPAEVPSYYTQAYNGVIQSNERKIFAGMLSCMDEGIGNLTNVLSSNGYLDNNTIIVFTSDNGGLIPIPGVTNGIGSSNYPLRGGKQAIWEGGTRLTGYIWGTSDIIPIELRGTNYTQLMHVVDWYKTILTIANISWINYNILNYTIDGVDQWNTIIGNNISDDIYFVNRNNIYYGNDINKQEYPGNNTGYRYQWLKVFNQSGGLPDTWIMPLNQTDIKIQTQIIQNNISECQLYNINNDPFEYNDISQSNQNEVGSLLKQMNVISSTAVPIPNETNCSQPTHPEYPIVGKVWVPWCG